MSTEWSRVIRITNIKKAIHDDILDWQFVGNLLVLIRPPCYRVSRVAIDFFFATERNVARVWTE